MTSLQISKDEMLKRVARYKDLKPNKQAFVDSLLPGHQRENFRIIGRGVSEDPSHMPSITGPHDFNVGGIKAAPGNGAALHSHKTVEVFIPFAGQWAIYWGDDGENEVVLGPMDTFSVPPGVMRGFRNVSGDDAFLMTIVGGADPGKVTWPQKLLDEARENGAALDEQGNLVKAG